ncbi:MAG TPA: hypothetical protein VFG42_07625 [Baekduia sp.]|uniref:hypothetical protein n=1 Tax=Baekduia sp. TaxID=2600305 RepID=UPI002D7898F6|nr:hypothetical protein [Baekduia sp.]HET6506642.1 hypothetical protein [Baekduia sp.]
MRRRPAFALAAAVAALATLSACSGPEPADLFVVSRTGTIPGAKLSLRFIDDGGVSCNRGPRKDITSAQLITARELRRELDGEKDDDVGLAEKHIDLPPGHVTTLSYRVRSENGTVAFSDTSAHQPKAFYRLAKLTRDVAQQSCGLAR